MTPNTGNFGPSLEQRLVPSIARSFVLSEAIFQSLRVALPGIVKSFDPGPPATVTVQIATDEYITKNTGPNNSLMLSSPPQPLPLLVSVPVQIYGGGGWNFTLPIQPEDECMVLFADTPLEVWIQNGGQGNNPSSQRRHDLSDGVALFGVRSKPNGLTSYSTNSAQIRNDDSSVVIDLADDQITVTAPSVVVNCSDMATVSADTITITGSTSVTLGSNTTIDGKDFLLHSHGGVMTGGGATGPVI